MAVDTRIHIEKRAEEVAQTSVAKLDFICLFTLPHFPIAHAHID